MNDSNSQPAPSSITQQDAGGERETFHGTPVMSLEEFVAAWQAKEASLYPDLTPDATPQEMASLWQRILRRRNRTGEGH